MVGKEREGVQGHESARKEGGMREIEHLETRPFAVFDLDLFREDLAKPMRATCMLRYSGYFWYLKISHHNSQENKWEARDEGGEYKPPFPSV